MMMITINVTGVELTTGQRRESYDGVHYSDLTYDAFAQVAMNLMAHLERTGTIDAARETDEPVVPFVKVISGMGNIGLGLMVLLLASIMVLSRDAYHGVARLALEVLGGSQYDPATMTWEAVYGDLLRKLGRHPDGTGSAGAPPQSKRASPAGRPAPGLGAAAEGDGADKALLGDTETEGRHASMELTSAKYSVA